MSKTTSFPELCRKFSNDMADLMEHPECPRTLRQMLVECALDIQLESNADVDRQRELLEVRELLPIYLAGYQKPARAAQESRQR